MNRYDPYHLPHNELLTVLSQFGIRAHQVFRWSPCFTTKCPGSYLCSADPAQDRQTPIMCLQRLRGATRRVTSRRVLFLERSH